MTNKNCLFDVTFCKASKMAKISTNIEAGVFQLNLQLISAIKNSTEPQKLFCHNNYNLEEIDLIITWFCLLYIIECNRISYSFLVKESKITYFFTCKFFVDPKPDVVVIFRPFRQIVTKLGRKQRNREVYGVSVHRHMTFISFLAFFVQLVFPPKTFLKTPYKVNVSAPVFTITFSNL